MSLRRLPQGPARRGSYQDKEDRTMKSVYRWLAGAAIALPALVVWADEPNVAYVSPQATATTGKALLASEPNRQIRADRMRMLREQQKRLEAQRRQERAEARTKIMARAAPD